MLTLWGRRQRTCAGLSRRALVRAGGAGLLGWSLPQLLAAEALAGNGRPRAKSVIFVFLYGGPSQLETFDMKPDAASTIRGPFAPIDARTPGLLVCEHLPRLAQRSDKYAVVRTVNHDKNDHNGTHIIQTGHPIPPAERGAAMVDATDKDWPAFGSVVEYLDQRARGGRPADFPGYVYLPRRLGHMAGYDINGQYAGWLGAEYNGMATEIRKRDPADNPFFRDCTDEELDFRLSGLEPLPELSLERFDRREGLLAQFDAQRRRLDEALGSRNVESERRLDEYRARALALLTAPQVRDAFDIRREPDALRDRYGRNLFGQSLLMGRRMIEAGSRFVTVAWDLAVRGDVCGSWDMHSCLERVMRNHLLPGLDQGLSTLLDDLAEKGLQDETLVVAVGEMGRTPRFQNRGQEDGRDHWTYCFPAILAGAGLRGGALYGRSDKDAAWPIENPVSPADLACTIYEALGIDPHGFIHDRQGRPVRIQEEGRSLYSVLG